MMMLLTLLLGEIPTIPDVDGGFFKNFISMAGWVVSVLMAIACAVWKVMGGGRTREISPQPLTVREHEDFVTRREFNDLKAEVRRGQDEMKAMVQQEFRELKTERTESINHIHAHIDSAVRNIKDDVKDVKKDVSEVDERVADRLKDGAKTMVTHGEEIAALKAILNKGGKR